MPKFEVDPQSLLDVSNSLSTLHGVLNDINTSKVILEQADLGGQPMGQAISDFNANWIYGVQVVSDEVTNMMTQLVNAAQAYERIEQRIAHQSHDHPVGQAPGIGGGFPTHNHPEPRHHKDKGHHKAKPAPTHTHEPPKHTTHEGGPTTVGGPGRAGPTGLGGTAGSGSGEPTKTHKKHTDSGSGHGTVTIGPGGTSWSVTTGPGEGHGTTIIDGTMVPGSPASAGLYYKVGSKLLTPPQEEFVTHMSHLSGLSPRVVASWMVSGAPSGGAAANAQTATSHNYLGLQGDPGQANAWSDPAGAAAHSVRYLQGEWGAGGQSVLAARAGTDQQQLAAISASGHGVGSSALADSYGRLSDLTVTPA